MGGKTLYAARAGIVFLGVYLAALVGLGTARKIVEAGNLGGDFRFLASKIVQPVTSMYSIDFNGLQFAYPPTMPLLMWPFAEIGGMMGYVAFIVLSAGALIAVCCRHISRTALALMAISFPFVNVVLIGQPTFLIVALTLAGLSLPNRYIAGLLFAVAAGIKPQLVALIPLYLLINFDWRAFAAAALGYGFLVIMSALVFGVQAWIAWPATIASYRTGIFNSGVIQWVIAPIGMFERWGYPALPITVACAVGALALALLPYRRPIDALFGLTLGAILILPYGCPDNALGLMPLVAERLLRGKPADVLPFSFMFPATAVMACFVAIAEIVVDSIRLRPSRGLQVCPRSL